MTNEIKELIEAIKTHPIFDQHPFFFVGGTALSSYLNHRVSYDIASTCKLPVSQIKTFAFKLGARAIVDKNDDKTFHFFWQHIVKNRDR